MRAMPLFRAGQANCLIYSLAADPTNPSPYGNSFSLSPDRNPNIILARPVLGRSSRTGCCTMWGTGARVRVRVRVRASVRVRVNVRVRVRGRGRVSAAVSLAP